MEECTICFEKLYGKLVDLECGHSFHFNCITKWYKYPNSNYKCPLCSVPREIIKIKKKCIEGFICPKCYLILDNQEDLLKHFQECNSQADINEVKSP